MKKLIFLCALSCALFSACQKDCEKDKTASVKITNQIPSTVNFSTPSGNRLIETGETISFDVELDNSINGSPGLIESMWFSYRIDGVEGVQKVGLTLHTCETTESILTE